MCLFAKQSATYKGRAFHRTPPAQNRTCGFPAYGSHLGCVTANCRMRSSACDTLIRFCARHVLCWPAFPLVPALRSIDSAAADSAADCSAAGRHVVRRLPSYYGEVRLLVPVHHRLRLLVFPMRTIVLGTYSTPMARPEISQLPMRSLCT